MLISHFPYYDWTILYIEHTYTSLVGGNPPSVCFMSGTSHVLVHSALGPSKHNTCRFLRAFMPFIDSSQACPSFMYHLNVFMAKWPVKCWLAGVIGSNVP